MNKLALLLALALILAVPSVVFAQDDNSQAGTTLTPTVAVTPGISPRPRLLNKVGDNEGLEKGEGLRKISPKLTPNVDKKVADLKTRGDAEISRRVASLNELITRISKIRKLSDTQKSDLTGKVQAEIDTLNTLKTKIDADTDITTLKTDVKSIVDSYRVFVVFMPQIQLIGAADRLLTVSANLAVIGDKLKTRIADAKTAGNDTTAIESLLTDLTTKLTDANTQANAIIAEVIVLTPEGYPANKTTIQDARSKLKTGTTDVKTARQDAMNIIKQLKTWGKVVSPTTTVTPTGSI